MKHYEIFGPLFFGSTTLFLSKFDVAEDPDEVIIDFEESRIADHSAIEAINKLAARYQRAGKTLHLRHLSADCRRLVERADTICDVNVLEDPSYYVAVDNYRASLTRAHAADDDELHAGAFEDLRHSAKALRRQLGAGPAPAGRGGQA